MPLFNVVAPCVVNGLHYVHPTKQPIEVDDDQAAELVEAGSLEPYPKPAVGAPVESETAAVDAPAEIGDGRAEESPIRRTRKPRTED